MMHFLLMGLTSPGSTASLHHAHFSAQSRRARKSSAYSHDGVATATESLFKDERKGYCASEPDRARPPCIDASRRLEKRTFL